MAPSSRDRLSVDLQGLKAALLDRAKALCVTPSGYVRTTLMEALGRAADVDAVLLAPRALASPGNRVRVCVRMSRQDASAAMEAARHARLPLGDYFAGLVSGVPVLSGGGSRADHIAALIASSAELSTLSRNIHRLTVLLRQADIDRARPYREMLDTLAADVRGHLQVAAQVLADLQPQRRPSGVASRADA
jgi:hypothetical protein